jgi:hypothetical protein
MILYVYDLTIFGAKPRSGGCWSCKVTNILEYISINKSSIIRGGPGWQRS